MPPKLPELRIGDHAVSVDRISGHGRASATLSVTRLTPGGKPSRALSTQTVSRADLTAYALELLDLAESMVHDGAFASSFASPDGISRAMISRRKDNAVLKFFRIEDRLPILQMCQRLLETGDDAMTRSLLLLMSYAETKGQIPVNFDLTVDEAPLAPRH